VTPGETPHRAAAPSPPPDDRPMGAIYVAVILVEIVTLLALWWFQTTFSHV
jgi:hypothetical protein